MRVTYNVYWIFKLSMRSEGLPLSDMLRYISLSLLSHVPDDLNDLATQEAVVEAMIKTEEAGLHGIIIMSNCRRTLQIYGNSRMPA